MKIPNPFLTILIFVFLPQAIYSQCNCQTLKRPDATIIQCPPNMVAKDTETEIGLAVASNGQDQYLTLMVRFVGSASIVSGELTVWLEDGNYFSLSYINGGLSYIDDSQVANAVFTLDSNSVAKLKSSELKTVAFSLSNGLRRSYQVTSNSNIIKTQLNCI